METVELEYRYGLRWWMIVLMGTMFTAIAVGEAVIAIDNKDGLVIARVIKFGPEGASVCHWIMSGFSCAMVLLAIILAYRRVKYPRRVALGTDCLILPAPKRGSPERVIPYSSIRDVSTTESGLIQILSIVYEGGQASIDGSSMPSKAAYCEFKAALLEKVSRSFPPTWHPGGLLRKDPRD